MAEVQLDSVQDLFKNAPENLIIATHKITSKMEKETEKLVKGANQDEKDVQELWRAANSEKRKKELQISQMHMRSAYISMALMATNVICSIGGTALNLRAGSGNLTSSLANYTRSGGDVLTRLGSAVGDHGQKLSDSIQQSKIQLLNSALGKYTERGQEIWEVTKRDREARKEDLKQIQQKTKQNTEEAISKSGMAYSNR